MNQVVDNGRQYKDCSPLNKLNGIVQEDPSYLPVDSEGAGCH